MKKLVLSILILTGISVTNAQKIKFGAKTGLNLASLKIGNLPEGVDPELGEGISDAVPFMDSDQKISFFAGLMAEIKLSDKFAVQPELLYSSQGGIKKIEFNNSSSENGIQLDYINLPIMAKYEVIDGLSLEVGPQVGFLINATPVQVFNGKDMNEGLSDEYKDFIKDQFKSIDFGLNFGASYTLNNLNFGARYNLGLSDVIKYSDGVDTSNAPTVKNGTIQFSVGYFF